MCECENMASLRHAHLVSFFLDPEDVKRLRQGAIWSFSKGTGLLWPGIRLWGTKGSNPITIYIYFFNCAHILLFCTKPSLCLLVGFHYGICISQEQFRSQIALSYCIVFIVFHVYVAYYWTYWRSWLRHCATSRKVAGSITDGVIGIFHWHNPSGCTMALGSTQPLTEMDTRNISWGVKAAGG